MHPSNLTHLGDTAVLVEVPSPQHAQHLAGLIRAARVPGLEDVVPGARTVGLVFDPAEMPLAQALASIPVLPVLDAVAAAPRGRVRTFEVEVCFDGPDLEALATAAKLTPPEVVRLVTEAELHVGWLGFMPGFPYLLGLPAPLDSVGRLGEPRVRVEAGSVAIAGGYAGIYPLASPGGWNVIGRTAFQLFDDSCPPYATLGPGDVVRFRAVASTPEPADARAARSPVAAGERHIAVIDGGFLTTVQDYGRLGVAHLGVPRAGPADPLRHAIANAAVGNPVRGANLEITAAGPTLAFECDAYVALVGECSLRIDGREMPAGAVQKVESGQVVAIGRVTGGMRAYLGVSPALDSPRRFGSWSADTVSCIWPGPLRAGDRLAVSDAGAAHPRGRFGAPGMTDKALLHVTPGPLATTDPGRLESLSSHAWEVTTDCDRTGTRFRRADGEEDMLTGGTLSALLGSQATVTGAIQLPPDGRPLLLGPDHGTVGGYEVVAVLRRSDLTMAGQLAAGTVVEFSDSPVAGEPVEALARRAVSGWLLPEPGVLP